MTYNFHVPLGKMMCHFFEKFPKFYRNSSKSVVLRRVLLGESTVASTINIGVTNVSVGLVTNRGLVEQVPSHFNSIPVGTTEHKLNRFPVPSHLFSLDIVVTLVHTFPGRTRQPSQRLGA